MDQKVMFRHAFEAFSTLSDAQDTMVEAPTTAHDLINHAKEHLDAIRQLDPEGWFRAMTAGGPGCSLNNTKEEYHL